MIYTNKDMKESQGNKMSWDKEKKRKKKKKKRRPGFDNCMDGWIHFGFYTLDS